MTCFLNELLVNRHRCSIHPILRESINVMHQEDTRVRRRPLEVLLFSVTLGWLSAFGGGWLQSWIMPAWPSPWRRDEVLSPIVHASLQRTVDQFDHEIERFGRAVASPPELDSSVNFGAGQEI